MKSSIFVLAFGMLLAASVNAQNIGATDIGGVVNGAKGPETGVWVIAETTDLPTRFARIVVTDERGRYLIPDLPKANYSVWVRGYGLIDSPKLRAIPGQRVNHAAVAAPNPAAAAHYYPAIYWYPMMKIPAASEFGGSGKIPKNITLSDYLTTMKNQACVGCHQLGQESTRTIPAALADLKGEEAWMRRVQSGQAAPLMINPLAGKLGGAPFGYLADWTDRVAKGALPHSRPQRPQGVERNIVVTWWEWGEPKKYLHDLIASDRRYPTVNAYGPLYGSPEYSSDNIPILDPVKNTATSFHAPVRDPDMPLSLGPGHVAALKPLMPSAYWGDEAIWSQRINNNNSMIGRDVRLWLAAAVRVTSNHYFCN